MVKSTQSNKKANAHDTGKSENINKSTQKSKDIIAESNRRLVVTTLIVAAFVVAFSVFFVKATGLDQEIAKFFNKPTGHIVIVEKGNGHHHSDAFEARITELLESQTEKNGLKRALLGVKYVTVDDSVAEKYNLPVTEGAYLGSIATGGAADKAGLKPGDVITFINKTRVTADNPLNYLIAKFADGDIINVTYLRDGKERVVKVTLRAQE